MDRKLSEIIDDGHDCPYKARYEELLYLFENSNIEDYSKVRNCQVYSKGNLKTNPNQL